jgi:hypothetical protein
MFAMNPIDVKLHGHGKFDLEARQRYKMKWDMPGKVDGLDHGAKCVHARF